MNKNVLKTLSMRETYKVYRNRKASGSEQDEEGRRSDLPRFENFINQLIPLLEKWQGKVLNVH